MLDNKKTHFPDFLTLLEPVDDGGFSRACPPDKIKNLLAGGVVDNATKMVLVNAIYFKGTWDKQFKEEETYDAQFKLNKVTQHKDSTEWRMMGTKAAFWVYEMILPDGAQST